MHNNGVSASTKGWDGNRTFTFYSNFLNKDKSRGVRNCSFGYVCKDLGGWGWDDVDDLVDDDVRNDGDRNLCDKNVGEKKGKKDRTEETPADQPVGAQLRPQHEVDVPGGNADNGGGGDFDNYGGGWQCLMSICPFCYYDSCVVLRGTSSCATANI